MISRFNEIIPFDRPSSPASSAPPWPSFGIPWHPQRETLEPERFNCEARSDLIVSARSASAAAAIAIIEKGRKCFLKSRRKIWGDMPFDSEKRTAYSSKLSLYFSFYSIDVSLNLPFSLLPQYSAVVKFIIIDMFNASTFKTFKRRLSQKIDATKIKFYKIKFYLFEHFRSLE